MTTQYLYCSIKLLLERHCVSGAKAIETKAQWECYALKWLFSCIDTTKDCTTNNLLPWETRDSKVRVHEGREYFAMVGGG